MWEGGSCHIQRIETIIKKGEFSNMDTELDIKILECDWDNKYWQESIKFWFSKKTCFL